MAGSRRPARRRSIASIRSAATSSARTSAATVHQTSSPRRTSATSRTTSDAGANADHCGVLPPSGAKAKPPQAIRPPPTGPPEGSTHARPTRSRQRAAVRSKRWWPLSSSTVTAPSVASAERSRSGCSKHIHGSRAAREASTTALGSTPSARRQLTAARVSPPRRAPRSARSSCATRRLRCSGGSANRPDGAGGDCAAVELPALDTTSPCDLATSRSRPCASSRSARRRARRARTRRSSRCCRSPRR